MIRAYLTNSYIEGFEKLTSMNEEADFLNCSMSYHYDNKSNNVLVFAEGIDADQFDQVHNFMFPAMDLKTRIADMPEDVITTVITELTKRGIVTDGSETARDLLENICLFFNKGFVGFGSILQKDFS